MKRIGISIVTVFCVLGLVTFAHAQEDSSIADLQAQIDALQEQVQSLQEQLQSVADGSEEAEEDEESEAEEEDEEEGEDGEESGPPAFVQTMFQGMRGDQVRKLQEVLSTDEEVYPEGLTTGYFGPMTEKALRRFQAQQGLPETGIFDTKTKQAINTILQEGAGNSGTIPPGLLKKFRGQSVLHNLPDQADERCKAAGNVPSAAAAPFADCPEDQESGSEEDESTGEEDEDEEESDDGDDEDDAEDDEEDEESSTTTDSTTSTSTDSS